MYTGVLASVVVDSLSAFFPGVQVLFGDLESAIKSHAVYAFQWKRYGALPETFDIHQRKALHLGQSKDISHVWDFALIVEMRLNRIPTATRIHRIKFISVSSDER